MSDGDRLTVDDIIRAGGCAVGIRRWFTARGDDLPAGLNLRGFLRDGIDVEMARALNDALVNRALELKETPRG